MDEDEEVPEDEGMNSEGEDDAKMKKASKKVSKRGLKAK